MTYLIYVVIGTVFAAFLFLMIYLHHSNKKAMAQMTPQERAANDEQWKRVPGDW